MFRARPAPAVPAMMFLGLALSLFTADAQAQPIDRDHSYEPLALNLALVAGVPTGEFAQHVAAGAGLGAVTVYDLDRHGVLGLRLDGSLLLYGHQTRRRPHAQVVQLVDPNRFGRVGPMDVETDNLIVSAMIGPQLTAPTGPVRPFLTAGVGYSFFLTVSSVSWERCYDDEEETERAINFADATPAWSLGGGIEIDLTESMALTIGGRYLRNGTARYLKAGSIQETSDGYLYFDPIESRADLLTIQIGISLLIGEPTGQAP